MKRLSENTTCAADMLSLRLLVIAVAASPSAALSITPTALSRRAFLPLSLAVAVTPEARAAEPEPAPACDDACMEERIRRKQEALKKQDRRGAADVKVLYGASFQKGVRETKKQSDGILGFLTPVDVGGVNLSTEPPAFFK